MRGLEHYRVAEDLILAQTKPDAMNPSVRILREHASPEVIATAQVHALLAIAKQLESIDDALRNTVGGRS